MIKFKTIKDFCKFIQEYNGDIVVKKNIVLEGNNIIAILIFNTDE